MGLNIDIGIKKVPELEYRIEVQRDALCIKIIVNDDIIYVNSSFVYKGMLNTLLSIHGLDCVRKTVSLLKSSLNESEFAMYLDYLYKTITLDKKEYNNCEDGSLLIRKKLSFIEDLKSNIFFV